MERVPIPIKESIEEPSAKVRITTTTKKNSIPFPLKIKHFKMVSLLKNDPQANISLEIGDLFTLS